MARDPLEVLVGTGTLYAAPLGEAFPTDPTTAVAGNWEDVGYSDEGWSFVADRTFEDVEVAEEVDPLRVLKTAQELRFRGTFAQASLENFQIALGGGTITSSDPSAGFRRYTPPASSEQDEFALLFRTNAPPGDGTKLRDFRIQRCISTGAVEMAHAKAPAKTVIAADFRLILPAAGDIFDIIEAV